MQSEMCWLETLALEVNQGGHQQGQGGHQGPPPGGFQGGGGGGGNFGGGPQGGGGSNYGGPGMGGGPNNLVECKEAAGMRGTLGATEGILGATEGVIGKGVAGICKSGWTFSLDLLTIILLKLSMRPRLRYKILIMSLTVCSNMIMNSPSLLSNWGHWCSKK